MKKNQVFIGFGLLAAMIFLTYSKYQTNSKLALFLLTGLMLGYVLQRSRFGFAGGIRKIAMTGDGTLSKALLFLFAITVIGAAGIHYGAAQGGAEAAFRAAKGAATIPGTGSVADINLALVVGGLLFGIGMILGGGCASGTLTDVGEGSGRGFIALIFFCLGGMLGTWQLPSLKNTVLFQGGTKVYLPDTFGYVGAVLVSLAMLFLLYAIVRAYESKRRKAGTYEAIKFEKWEEKIEEGKEFKLFSWETYHKLFVERWSLFTGVVLIGVLFIFIINTTKSSWGASGPYTHWGVWFFNKLGVNFSSMPAFAGSAKVVNAGILTDPVSLRNIGMIAGAAICMLLAGRWKLNLNFKAKDVAFYALGGLLMGYGAKLAGGCNVGALFSGIANMSLSGWIFMAALIAGGMLGVKLVKKFNIPA